jgi:hypothetical protein
MSTEMRVCDATILTCGRCVLDKIEVPDLRLDGSGVCQYCREWERVEFGRRAEAQNLPWLYDRLRSEGKGRKYDCLIGLSGGADSAFSLMRLVDNGIRPLCFTMDNGWNDPRADQNVMRLVRATDVPLLRPPLDLEAFRRVQSAFLKSGVPNVEIPTDHCLMALSYRLADKYGIRTIIGGGNHATEGIMPPSYGHNARDYGHVRNVCRAFDCLDSLSRLPTITLPQYLNYRFLKGIGTVNLPDYYAYVRDEAVRELADRFGFEDYGMKHGESVFTAWVQNRYLPWRWNRDKRKPHYSSLVNSGQMTRKEAMNALLAPLEYVELPELERKVAKCPQRPHGHYGGSEWAWAALSGIYGAFKR